MAKVVEEYSSLKVATDVGLLDLVSALLGCIGILLAIFAFVAFFHVKHLARRQAEETARETASGLAESVAIERLEQSLPRMVDEYMELARNRAEFALADEVAQSQGDDEGV